MREGEEAVSVVSVDEVESSKQAEKKEKKLRPVFRTAPGCLTRTNTLSINHIPWLKVKAVKF